MTECLKILVAGRVQGVYYRVFTQKEANRLGVVGTVKNLPCGRVEILAEAEKENLQKFVAWCHKGSLAARVDSVEVTEIKISEKLTGFVIIK